MATDSAILQVLNGNSQFTTNLYQILSKDQGNVIFSPISLHAVLSMAYQGAQGNTSKLFASALQVPEAKTAAVGYNAILQHLNAVQNITLLMANKVYLMDGEELLTDFSNAITKQFLSEVQLVNFAENEAAAKTINAWVEEKTQEKIKDLISPDDLDALTRLVLVNAIYFKGAWQNKFDVAKTRPEPFYLNDVDSVEVQMMHTKNYFNYKNDRDLDAQVLELPYINEDLSMIIILPKKRNGIVELEKKLATVNLSEIANKMWHTDARTEVNVALPKFKIGQTIDLKEPLVKLGLGDIFDPNKANFRGMIKLHPDQKLYVKKVVQKAFIEVNEEGAEATAASEMIMVLCSATDPEEFQANHPFIYLVSHKGNNLLFAGRISNFEDM